MSHRILKGLRFTLQAGADSRRHNFCRRFVDEICGFADCDSRSEIEEQSDTGELIEMIHCLRAQRFGTGCIVSGGSNDGDHRAVQIIIVQARGTQHDFDVPPLDLFQ